MDINVLSAPVMMTWQLTRDCDLACLHCCTDSAPGKALPGELSREQALIVAEQIVELGVPYVMLCGGEPTLVRHFLDLARRLGRGGVLLKVETNGQSLSPELAWKLAELPIRSIQISLDGDTQGTYAAVRPRASLAAAWAACRVVTAAKMPLEVTFAPTRLNLHEAEAVIDRAASFGAFRFNTGRLMRLGTAAKLWDKIAPGPLDDEAFLELLLRKEKQYADKMELCFRPLSLLEDIREQLRRPSGTLLALPDGRVKVAAPLPFVCADLRRRSLADAWTDYRRAWSNPAVHAAAERLLADPALLSQANLWTDLPQEMVTSG